MWRPCHPIAATLSLSSLGPPWHVILASLLQKYHGKLDISVTFPWSVIDLTCVIMMVLPSHTQAAQIIIALIHCALGVLCFRLFLQEENIPETGYVPVPVTLIYTFWTVPFVSKPWYS